MFYRLPMRSAASIDRAVIRLAETGEGHLEWVAPHYRLYVGPFDIPVVLDRKERSLSVLRILRLAR